jgi:hypothetical protein
MKSKRKPGMRIMGSAQQDAFESFVAASGPRLFEVAVRWRGDRDRPPPTAVRRRKGRGKKQESTGVDDAPMRSTAGVLRGRPSAPIAAVTSALAPAFPGGSMAALVAAVTVPGRVTPDPV